MISSSFFFAALLCLEFHPGLWAAGESPENSNILNPYPANLPFYILQDGSILLDNSIPAPLRKEIDKYLKGVPSPQGEQIFEVKLHGPLVQELLSNLGFKSQEKLFFRYMHEEGPTHEISPRDIAELTLGIKSGFVGTVELHPRAQPLLKNLPKLETSGLAWRGIDSPFAQESVRPISWKETHSDESNGKFLNYCANGMSKEFSLGDIVLTRAQCPNGGYYFLKAGNNTFQLLYFTAYHDDKDLQLYVAKLRGDNEAAFVFEPKRPPQSWAGTGEVVDGLHCRFVCRFAVNKTYL